MREPVAIFGGSFDPVHSGHLELARLAIARSDFQSIVWVPAASNPLKLHNPIASDYDRLYMVKQSVQDFQWSEVSDIELRRGGHSYMVDTVEQLIDQYGLQQKPGLIMGEDAFASLPRWRGWDRLIKQCRILVFSRNTSAPDVWQEVLNKGGHVQQMSMPVIPISSTQIRQSCMHSAVNASSLPRPVHQHIVSAGLYTQLYMRIRAHIEADLSHNRCMHTLRVESLAIELAQIYGVSQSRVRIAALAHDLAREWSEKQLYEYAEQAKLGSSEIEQEHPVLLHGACAAHLIQKSYGICDEEILDAVRYHTLGRAGMGEIAKLLYIADYMEPGRSFDTAELRQSLQNHDLTGSCICVIRHQQQRFGELAPMTQRFLDWLQGK